LLGLGLDEFSMAAVAIPEVKARLRQLDSQACAQVAAKALDLPTTRSVKEYLQRIEV
jgi:phosphoenolpyruvate-protein kinase (PTS system EI component)